jgi:RHS repeat-associated protein
MLDNLNLTHMNGRVYDQWLGRFLSADPTIPSIHTQDFNRYSYVRNNPLTLTDPSGLSPGAHDHQRQYEDGDSGMWGMAEVRWVMGNVRFMQQFLSGPPNRNYQAGMNASISGGQASAETGMQWFQRTRMSNFRGTSGPVDLSWFVDDKVTLGGHLINYDVTLYMFHSPCGCADGYEERKWNLQHSPYKPFASPFVHIPGEPRTRGWIGPPTTIWRDSPGFEQRVRASALQSITFVQSPGSWPLVDDSSSIDWTWQDLAESLNFY